MGSSSCLCLRFVISTLRITSFAKIVLLSICLIQSLSAQTYTVTFNYTGSYQTWIVPQGVDSVEVTAKGGRGGEYYGSYGSGIQISSKLRFNPGDSLHIIVGGGGGDSDGFSTGTGGGGSGVFNVTQDTVMMVAGGGGGGNCINCIFFAVDEDQKIGKVIKLNSTIVNVAPGGGGVYAGGSGIFYAGGGGGVYAGGGGQAGMIGRSAIGGIGGIGMFPSGRGGFGFGGGGGGYWPNGGGGGGSVGGGVGLNVESADSGGSFVSGVPIGAFIPGATLSGMGNGQIIIIYDVPEIELLGSSISILDSTDITSTLSRTDFGSLDTSQMKSDTFYIKNIGFDTLIIDSIRIDGINSSNITHAFTFATPNYTIGDPIGFGPDSILLKVTFDPTILGADSALITLYNNDIDEGDFDLKVTGAGGVAEIHLIGNSMEIVDSTTVVDIANGSDFGAVDRDSTRIDTFYIKNIGTGDLVIDSIRVSSIYGSTGAFSIVTTEYRIGDAIGVSPDSVLLEVIFSPTMVGLDSALVTIYNIDADEPDYDLKIRGAGVMPAIRVLGNHVELVDSAVVTSSLSGTDFGNLDTANMKMDTFYIKNTGSKALTITDISLNGISGSNTSHAFTYSTPGYTLGESIAIDIDSVLLKVTYSPTTIGADSVLITIVHDDYAGGDFDLKLTGVYIAPDMEVYGNASAHQSGTLIAHNDVNPSAANGTFYGELCAQTVDSFYIRNNGTSDLIIDTIKSVGLGSNPGRFSVDENLFDFPQTIGIEDSLWFRVSFVPESARVDSAVVLIESNDRSKAPFLFVISAILDTTKPILSCMDSTVYLSSSGTVSIDSSYVLASLSDNCALRPITLSKYSFGCTDTMSNTVMVTVQDINGNVSTCMSVVTVLDTISPTAICQDTTITLDGISMFTIDSSFIDSGSGDNCMVETMTLSQYSFGTADIGPNTISMLVTDVNGNINTCSSDVTIQIEEGLFIICPPERKLDHDTYEGDKASLSIVGKASVFNSCLVDQDSLFFTDDVVCIWGNERTINRAWHVADTCGNKELCTQIINVTDVQEVSIYGPAIVCKGTTFTFYADDLCNSDGYEWSYTGNSIISQINDHTIELAINDQSGIMHMLSVKVWHDQDTIRDTIAVMVANDFLCSLINCGEDIVTMDVIIMAANLLPNKIHAVVGIESNGIVKTGENYDFKAGQYINLNKGFEVKQNAVFLASIEPCTNPVAVPQEDILKEKDPKTKLKKQ